MDEFEIWFEQILQEAAGVGLRNEVLQMYELTDQNYTGIDSIIHLQNIMKIYGYN